MLKMKGKSAAAGQYVERKSRVGELTREIDGLVREFVQTNDPKVAGRAAKLSKEREDLLKPGVIRSGRILKAG